MERRVGGVGRARLSRDAWGALTAAAKGSTASGREASGSPPDGGTAGKEGMGAVVRTRRERAEVVGGEVLSRAARRAQNTTERGVDCQDRAHPPDAVWAHDVIPLPRFFPRLSSGVAPAFLFHNVAFQTLVRRSGDAQQYYDCNAPNRVAVIHHSTLRPAQIHLRTLLHDSIPACSPWRAGLPLRTPASPRHRHVCITKSPSSEVHAQVFRTPGPHLPIVVTEHPISSNLYCAAARATEPQGSTARP